MTVSSAVKLMDPEEPSAEMSAMPRTPRKVLQWRPGVNRLSQDPVWEKVAAPQPVYACPLMVVVPKIAPPVS